MAECHNSVLIAILITNKKSVLDGNKTVQFFGGISRNFSLNQGSTEPRPHIDCKELATLIIWLSDIFCWVWISIKSVAVNWGVLLGSMVVWVLVVGNLLYWVHVWQLQGSWDDGLYLDLAIRHISHGVAFEHVRVCTEDLAISLLAYLQALRWGSLTSLFLSQLYSVLQCHVEWIIVWK